MDLPPELLVIHQPARLKIMGLLYKQRDVAYTRVRDTLGLTDGNLASHAKTLAEHGYIEGRRVLTRDGFEMRYRITKTGSMSFRRYLDELRSFLGTLDDGTPSPPDGRRDTGTDDPAPA